MRALALCLSPAQEAELVALRDHHPRPYLRERAAALLKVAAGVSARQVAVGGLYRPRKPATVRSWVARYRAQGSAGLSIQGGRGRKPAFFPSGERPR